MFYLHLLSNEIICLQLLIRLILLFLILSLLKISFVFCQDIKPWVKGFKNSNEASYIIYLPTALLTLRTFLHLIWTFSLSIWLSLSECLIWGFDWRDLKDILLPRLTADADWHDWSSSSHSSLMLLLLLKTSGLTSFLILESDY